MSSPAFAVGDLVKKLKGVDAGKTGEVDSVVDDGKAVRLRVIHRRNSTESVLWKLQSASNYERVDGSPAENAPHEDAYQTPPSSPRTMPDSPPPRLVADRVTRQTQHSFTVAAWNAHQLTFMDDPDKAELIQGLAKLMVMDWKLDVLMISEVPKKCGIARAKHLCRLLNEMVGAASDLNELPYKEAETLTDGFCMHVSEPSGVHREGGKENRPEYHVMLVRRCLEVEEELTHHMYLDNCANGYKLDHAPYTLFVRDTRFKDIACQRIAVTSVHLPPTSRRASCRRQGKGFLENYLHQFGWEDKYKQDRPCTFSGMHKPFCTHIVGGDFNCNPSKELHLSSDWWMAFDDSIGTSYGEQAYDNWLVNSSAVQKVWLDIVKNVGALPLTQHTRDGLSDHDCILLTLMEKVPCR